MTTSEVAIRFDELAASRKQAEAPNDELRERIEVLEAEVEKAKSSSAALPSLTGRLAAAEASLGDITAGDSKASSTAAALLTARVEALENGQQGALAADLQWASRVKALEDSAVGFQASAASMKELERRLEAETASKAESEASPGLEAFSRRLAKLEELTYGVSHEAMSSREGSPEKSALSELQLSEVERLSLRSTTEALGERLSRLEGKVADMLGNHVGNLRMQLQEAMEKSAANNPALGVEVQDLVHSHLQALEGALGDCQQALSSLRSSPREPSPGVPRRVSFSQTLEG